LQAFFLDSGAGTGRYNMDRDLELVAGSVDDSFTLRFYTWEPYCVSLGANQAESDIDTAKLFADGFDLVRRPTGGRAVFHSEELTYSVVIRSGNWSPKEAYTAINEALLTGLGIYDPRLSDAGLSGEDVKFREHYRSVQSAACFSVPARSEVKIDGRKLIGSAQRKIGQAILQHGSINTGPFHKRIADYLILPEKEKESLIKLLESGTADIRTILGSEVDLNRLKTAILKGFELKFCMDFSFLEMMTDLNKI